MFYKAAVYWYPRSSSDIPYETFSHRLAFLAIKHIKYWAENSLEQESLETILDGGPVRDIAFQPNPIPPGHEPGKPAIDRMYILTRWKDAPFKLKKLVL